MLFYSTTPSVTGIWLQSFNHWIRSYNLELNGNVKITKVSVNECFCVTLLLLTTFITGTHIKWLLIATGQCPLKPVQWYHWWKPAWKPVQWYHWFQPTIAVSFVNQDKSWHDNNNCNLQEYSRNKPAILLSAVTI